MAAGLRIELFVDSLDDFVDFYRRVLRFEVADDRRATGSPYALMARDAIRIGASRAWSVVDTDSRMVPSGLEVVLEVDDVAHEYRLVAASGWPIESPLRERPWDLVDFRIRDPDGYYLRVTGR